ncbi:methyltransferase domain-containing protein [Dactylosporangium sp. NPDC051485]|uniref:methyltransferase domain-containing protein n=1 Tax=Dactylosporangium sp. NPDC051485 TaxID=3154846 RepID=UPI00342B87E9
MSSTSTRVTGGVEDRATYALSNGSDHATDRLVALDHFLDPVTTSVLDRLRVQPGDRCLEIGPGSGSIAWDLAGRVGPTGEVVAVDLDPSRLTPAGNLHIYRHDIRDGLPVGGPYNVIHARLVLVHLPERRQVLRMLADALAPGGWLVIGDFGDTTMPVYTSPSASDTDLYTRVVQGVQRVLEGHGVDMAWADDTHAAMRDAGLRNVDVVEHAESWTGGSTGIRMHQANTRQTQDELLQHGITAADLDRFRELMEHPDFAARSYRFVCTRGQRPPL